MAPVSQKWSVTWQNFSAKVMDTFDPPQIKLMKPGQLLGFFTLATLVCGICLFFIQYLPLSDNSVWKIEASNRLPVFGAWVALVGVIYSAKVAVTNLVRSHTVSTLLQSRLSETYMYYGDKVNSGIRDFKLDKASGKSVMEYVDRDALRYILNYHEFIAVGIRYGELSDEVMRAMMRGIICRAHDLFEDHINQLRNSNPKTLENLVWLRKKWHDDDSKEEFSKKYVPQVPGAAVFAIVFFLLLSVWPAFLIFHSYSYPLMPRDGNLYSLRHAFDACDQALRRKSASPHLMKIDRVPVKSSDAKTLVFEWTEGQVLIANQGGILRSATATCKVSGMTGDILSVNLALTDGL